MLRSRIIPCLLIHDGGLVKSTNFQDYKYVGDPLNAVRIFNEKEVDELMVIDIDASVNGREPNFELIKKMASECRMPLCYGGGIKTVEHAKKLVSLGAEKVAISSGAIEKPNILLEIGKAIGTQSVVIVLDVKKKKIWGGYEVYVYNGIKNTKNDPFDLAEELEKIGIGELVLNNIDLDGTMKGYDIELCKRMRERISVPMTILGGAGSLSDISGAIKHLGVVGAGAGSLFVFKGKYKAVLINYPDRATRAQIY
jgi:cyclase